MADVKRRAQGLHASAERKLDGKPVRARTRLLLLSLIVVTLGATVVTSMIVVRHSRGSAETGEDALPQRDGAPLVSILGNGDVEHPASMLLTTSMTSPLSKDDQTGFYDQILLEAFRRAGAPVRIGHLPTERSISNANLGITAGEFPRISGLERLYPNLHRVTEKIDDFEFVAFTWRTDIQITDWSSCTPYNVAIVRGWKILEANLAAAKSLLKVETQTQLFALLAEHRTDIVVYSRFEGYEIIKQLEVPSLRALEPPLATREMFLYLNKRHLPLVPALKQQLRGMKDDGTYDRIRESTLGTYREGGI